MEVIIAMGHFCDNHGPCVILYTHASTEFSEEQQSLDVPVCSACESIEFNTVYSCEDEKKQYVTSRTSFDSDTAHLLKDAVLRSLSIETVVEEGKTSGTAYFGDNNRGHIIAHVFSIKDSYARGFKRRYCLIVLGKNQISLLSHYDFIETNLKKISEDLQEKAENLNKTECTSTSNIKKILRPLPELVGEPNIFAQLHMWFVFLLRAEIFQIIPHNIPNCPINCSSIEKLRKLKLEMSNDVYNTISYCTLTGILVGEDNVDILKYFQELLPVGFKLPQSEQLCSVFKVKDQWNVNFKGTLPQVYPNLHTSIQKSLEDTNISDSALFYIIKSFIMHWFNIACVLSWTPNPSDKFFRTLEVRQCDMPMLSYWISESGKCVELCKTDYFKSMEIT